jgi:hypothetical protein
MVSRWLRVRYPIVILPKIRLTIPDIGHSILLPILLELGVVAGLQVLNSLPLRGVSFEE